jgi:hypothetical protein
VTERNYYGILSPLDYRYVEPKHDERIATSFERFCLFIVKYMDEHPEANWILPDDEMTTPH